MRGIVNLTRDSYLTRELFIKNQDDNLFKELSSYSIGIGLFYAMEW